MVTAAAPYASLSRERFDEAIDLAAKGIVTGRGRRGAHLHLDGVNGVVRPAALRGARRAPRRAARSPSSASTAWSSTPTT